MPINPSTFNTGQDLKITIIDNDSQALISVGGFISEGSFASMKDLTTIKPIDTPLDVNHQAFGNCTVTLTIERATGALYDLEAQLRADWKRDGTNHRFTVTASINNKSDGALNEYQFTNALFDLSSFGAFRKDQSVPMTVTFTADDYVKVA